MTSEGPDLGTGNSAPLALPRVALLAPANGDTFHEGEPVRFEVEMRNVTDAALHFDVGGLATDPRNPAPVPIGRAEDEPERFAVTATLPRVESAPDEDLHAP